MPIQRFNRASSCKYLILKTNIHTNNGFKTQICIRPALAKSRFCRNANSLGLTKVATPPNKIDK